MCTAVCLRGKDCFFGRTLDLAVTYGEEVVVTPRRARLWGIPEESHHAIIGVAHVEGAQALYYDAVNECGLACAALRFPRYAVYAPWREGGVPSFALLPWVLGRAATLAEARVLLQGVRITDEAAAPHLPATPLHWILADKTGVVTVESRETGLEILENPLGVLTNAPPFLHQCSFAERYVHLSPYPQGEAGDTGTVGLPGDFGSLSRFARAAYVAKHTVRGENTAPSDFFHLMEAVSLPRGAVLTAQGQPVCTQYTSLADTARGIYYFTTYANRRIRAVSLENKPLDGDEILRYTMDGAEEIRYL